MLIYDLIYLAIIVILFLFLLFSIFQDMYRKRDLEMQIKKYNKIMRHDS